MKNSDKLKSPIVNFYAIRDARASRFFEPFVSQNDETARRQFGAMVTVQDSFFGKNPDDFTLYRLGDFDPNDAQIDALSHPEIVCDALEFIKQ